MLGTAPPPATEVLYVRVSPQDKARLRVIADRDFGGSLAATVRYLLAAYADGKTRGSTVTLPNLPAGFLDEE
jgi:hypothetical protein